MAITPITKKFLKRISKSFLVLYLIAVSVSVTYSEESKMVEKWFNLGNEFYYGGNGKTKDYKKAFEYFEKAAKRDLVEAQYNLGIMYLNGFGCATSQDEAVKWFTRAAEQSDPDAQYLLGVMYRDGFGDTKNHYEAIEWLRKAAKQENADAQLDLGFMLLKYFPKSKYEEAITYFKMAAEQGNISAQQYLGYLYCLEKQYEEALKWSLAAAKMGDSKAQENIGRMYFYGQGVEQSYVQAYMWFTIASYDNNKFMQLVENQLSKKDIVQAKQMAIEWEEENFNKY